MWINQSDNTNKMCKLWAQRCRATAKQIIIYPFISKCNPDVHRCRNKSRADKKKDSYIYE